MAGIFHGGRSLQLTINWLLLKSFFKEQKPKQCPDFLPFFFERYPNWKILGEASETELQEITKPLGLWKQRGSRLFKLAQELNKRKGRFPSERSQVEELSMMGQYITNAFELYVLNKRLPLLDVNMARVLERLFGERTLSDIRYDPYLQSLAHRFVNIDRSKELNWAILDFAALVCKTRNPACSCCVINVKCKYFTKNEKHNYRTP